MDDVQIVELYMDRDERAIEETATRYGAQLNRISFHIVGNQSDADECENDTYFSAWKLIPPHEPKEYLFAFLARIIRNKSFNICKSRKTQKRSMILVELTKEIEECIPSPNSLESKLSAEDIGKIISSFLRSEKAESRNIFLRRYWFADSISDISALYHISESKVKSMLFRTRNKLREYLRKEGFQDEW